eukprot:TCONS_00053260-protein
MPTVANFNFINILTQNTRGIKSPKRIHELSGKMNKHNTFALCIQETWRSGDSIETINDCTFLLHGLPRELNTSRRGQGGVGIVLNNIGTQSWKEAGSLIITDFGPRIIATRLKVADQRNKPCCVFLISAYAPIGAAKQLTWNHFLDNLQKCIDIKHENDIMIIGCDTNSSMGTCNDARIGPSISSIGKFGIPYRNAAGTRFLTFLEI